MKPEFEIVREFTHKLGLENQTDGSLFIYNTKNGELRERGTNSEEARWILLF
jgi:hypothetical protein